MIILIIDSSCPADFSLIISRIHEMTKHIGGGKGVSPKSVIILKLDELKTGNISRECFDNKTMS